MSTTLNKSIRRKILTSQQPRGSPLAASNPAEMIVKSGLKSKAAKGGNREVDEFVFFLVFLFF